MKKRVFHKYRDKLSTKIIFLVIMPHGNKLNEKDQGIIIALRGEG